MNVVVNSTPLIALSLINQLELLNHLFDEVIIPSGVYQEVVIEGVSKPGEVELKDASWIKVQSVTPSSTIEPLLLGLDKGELQVILLALSIKPDWVIIDEKLGRKVAQVMGLPLKGTVGVLLAGFYSGYLSKQEVLDSLQQLVKKRIRISSQVINWVRTALDNY